MRTRRTPKAEIGAVLEAARRGDDDGLAIAARATMAYRVHIGRLIAGHETEATSDVEAGAILDAEATQAILRLRDMYTQVHKE